MRKMRKETKKSVLAGLRETSAELVGQLILYATLLAAVGAWFRFGSLHALLIVGAAGICLFWVVYAFIAGRKDKPG